ncbi:Flp pilus assembly protein TadG [Novosphingobium sp. GV055]|uniref:TadE/TadG family type IV pilus assembly protein n=1 Tax=Novosphingobium sp. GV055 TaxID=2135690 RepID=UPI000D30A09A|nr:TadE/TadG family type IV pilus assembly protein [Novosphingobium sp. GV055]PTR08254.1 Flp pilus assembly protein TadG [Novosphingobium sp. GV055]PUB01008.1 Flp pilus assembly protein TadG [Novosphingobium sp. GV061]PUB16541.1 Flp pilus assembly protein TadG [Novosphingobium sp. GV079]PUB39845.1 Flp pilus assembly protein TadG [Novosphingobium sp. GV027]
MLLGWLRQRLKAYRGSRGQHRAQGPARGFMGRLAKDRAGNALAIMTLTAFTMITLAGLGMDMSRAYLTKTSLQDACDAGVLAGRKAMAASGVYGAAEQAKANKMFNFNINENRTESSAAVFTTSADTTGHVSGTASTTMPTTLMKLFNYSSLPMTVECSAELQMANADVMFVLDTTGSMACNVSGGNCYSGSDSKIVGLQNAIRSFYTTVAGAVVDKVNTRVRFGFVPYSMTVNAKGLLTSGAMPSNYFVNSSPYITQLVQFSTTPITVNKQTRYPAISYRYAQTTMDVTAFKGFGSVPLATGVTLYNGNNASSASYVTTKPSSTNPYYTIRDLATGTTATGTVGNVTTTSYTWSGCIEERNTVPQLSMSPIPSGAYDMDVTSAPTNDATSWKPYLESLEFYLNGYSMPLNTTTDMSNQTGYCPQSMLPFTTVDTTAPQTVPTWLNNYVNSLYANGGTYHDIGMLWGARLGNPNGIFASNVNAGNLPSVSRHIIFMTDGTMENYPANYTAWGVTQYDGRDAPTSTSASNLVNYHNNRFLAACTLAKNMGYTIWVIGFGQTLTTQMQACATANRAYYASNTTALTTTFQYIAGQVANLRLNK